MEELDLMRQILSLQDENRELRQENSRLKSLGANVEREAIVKELSGMSHAEIEKNWERVQGLLKQIGQ